MRVSMASVGWLQDEPGRVVCAADAQESFYHMHACPPLHFRVARSSSFSARRLAPVVIGRGLWGPIDFELQVGESLCVHFFLQPPASPKFVNKRVSRLARGRFFRANRGAP